MDHLHPETDLKGTSPLVLGTAQLGMEYGIANNNGKPDLEQAVQIIKTACENGIRFFDTAQAYGDSEEVLGRCFKELGRVYKNGESAVISKIRPDISPNDAEKILREVDESLKRLHVNQLWGLLVHRESWLKNAKNNLRQIGLKLKLEKKIQNFGISVYAPEKAVEALKMDEIDIIQLPFNVFDQRVLDYGVFPLARDKNKKVFIRSVYLQGLLLLNPHQLPHNFDFSKLALKKFNDFARIHDISQKLLALSFVSQKAPGEMIVVGAEKPEQVKENIFLLKQAGEINLPDMSSLSSNDPKLINPSLWPH